MICEGLRGICSRLSSQPNVRQLSLYLLLNCGFMFIEFAYGLLTNSLGLVSDAVHMLFDCLAVAVALAASIVSTWPATECYTYGFGRFEVLAGFVNGVMLLFTSFGIMVSSIERMLEPKEITHLDTLFVVACLGFGVNAVGLLLFHEHAHAHAHVGGECACSSDRSTAASITDLDKLEMGEAEGGNETAMPSDATQGSSANMRGMFLHILGDTLGSAAVVASSLVVRYFNWTFFDTVTSVAISVMLFVLVWPLIQSTAFVLLQRQPVWLDAGLQGAVPEVLSIQDVYGLRCARFWCVTPKCVEGSICISVPNDLSREKCEVARCAVIEHFAAQGVVRMAVQLDCEATATMSEAEGGGYAWDGTAPTVPMSNYVLSTHGALRKDA